MLCEGGSGLDGAANAVSCVLMAVMFAPVVVLAILVHLGLEFDDRWLTVIVAVVGLLFSSMVSVPLQQFLLDLGNLPPNPRWEGK